MDFTTHVNRRKTSQREPVLGREAEMEANAAGGSVFKLDKWKRLRRFLILGSEGGTYYIGEKELTKQNAAVVLECLEENPEKATAEIAFVSIQGLAPKNDSAIFALALGASVLRDGQPDNATRASALKHLKAVCRTPTHLFQFAHYVSALRGWGKGLRNAVADWYVSKDVGHLGYQMAKYKSRKVGDETWTHANLLSKAHVEPGDDPVRAALFRWAANGFDSLDVEREVTRRRHDGSSGPAHVYAAPGSKNLPARVAAIRELARMGEKWKGTKGEIGAVIANVEEHRLSREMLPTQALNSPAVWEALLENMPATALIRTLGKMTSVGVLEQLSNGTAKAIAKLSDSEWLRKSRVHPINVLVALKS